MNTNTNDSRRDFVRGAAALTAVAAVVPSELLTTAFAADGGKQGTIAGLYTMNFSDFPALASVTGSVRLDPSKLAGSKEFDGIIVTRISATEFAAVSEVCTHQGCSVATFNGTSLNCPCHGSRYDAKGKVLEGPAVAALTTFTTSYTAGATSVQVDIPGFTTPVPVTPAATLSVTALAFGSVIVGASNTLSYTVAATNLAAVLVITAPSGAGLALTQNGTFTQSLTLQATNGSIASTTVFVRFAPTQAITLSGTIAHVSGTTQFAGIALSGSGVTPAATISATTLAFGLVAINGSSTQSVTQQYTIAASNLSTSLVITAPSGLGLSLTQNGTFTQTLTLQATANQIAQTTIFVRFAPTQAATLSGNITHASGTAQFASIAVSGSAIAPKATVTGITGTMVDFGAVKTGANAVRQYRVKAEGIIGSLQVTVPTGFTVSGTQNGAFQQTILIAALATTFVAEGDVFVRFAPTQVGNVQGDIQHSYNGQTLSTLRVTGVAEMGTGVAEELAASVEVYPNPASDAVFVGMNLEQPASVELTLHNLLGQEVLRVSEKASAGKYRTQLRIGALPAGVYSLRIAAGSATITKQVVKQ